MASRITELEPVSELREAREGAIEGPEGGEEGGVGPPDGEGHPWWRNLFGA